MSCFPWAYIRGRVVPIEEATINIQTHALQYGTGAFGGIRGYWDESSEDLILFRIDDHYRRLCQSARILFLSPEITRDQMVRITIDLVRRNEPRQNIYIRPILYKSALQLSPRLHDVEDDFAIYIIPLNDYLDVNSGLKCCVSSWLRIHDNAIPTRAKATGGYINSALAKTEAVLNGYDEAIFLDQHGVISEGSAENLFLVRDGCLITPPHTASILEGITRRTIKHLAREHLDIPVIERDIGRTELYIADEVFFAGTGVQVAWIRSIDHRIIGTGKIGPITQKLQSLYFDLVHSRLHGFDSWLTHIYRDSD